MANFWYYLLLGGGAATLLLACGRPDQPAQVTPPAPATVPTVVEAARYYAGLLARATPLVTPARRQYAGRQPTSQSATDADSSYSVCLSWRLPDYEVQAFLDHQQRPATISLLVPIPPEDPHRQVAEPWHAPGRLVRLGALRHAFGPGHMGQFRVLRQYEFPYRPVPAGPLLTIRAFLPTEQPTDSTMVEHLVISKALPD